MHEPARPGSSSGVGLYFFKKKFNEVNNVSFTPIIIKKMCRLHQLVAHHMRNPESGYYGGWKNKVFCFFHLKSHFQSIVDPKHLEKKNHKDLIKPIHSLQKFNKTTSRLKIHPK
jgi:hypothetical protein